MVIVVQPNECHTVAGEKFPRWRTSAWMEHGRRWSRTELCSVSVEEGATEEASLIG